VIGRKPEPSLALQLQKIYARFISLEESHAKMAVSLINVQDAYTSLAKMVTGVQKELKYLLEKEMELESRYIGYAEQVTGNTESLERMILQLANIMDRIPKEQ